MNNTFGKRMRLLRKTNQISKLSKINSKKLIYIYQNVEIKKNMSVKRNIGIILFTKTMKSLKKSNKSYQY
jgi:ABC-type lipoprotein export system ATPase subunit